MAAIWVVNNSNDEEVLGVTYCYYLVNDRVAGR